nr:hypothetical protein [Micromonospora sp. DSM 115978]
KEELNRLADEYLAEMDELYGPVTPEESAAAAQWLDGIEDQLRAADRALPARPAPEPAPASTKTGRRSAAARKAG